MFAARNAAYVDEEEETSTRDLHDLLMNWEDFCNEQSMMHDIARARYKFLNYLLALPSILLTTVSGAGNLSVDNNRVASFVLGSMALAAGAIFSIHRYMNLPELQQQHDFYSDEFLKLRNSIRLHKVITKTSNKTYASMLEFSKHINTQIDNCIDKSPSIPSGAVNKGRIRLGRSFTNLVRMHTDLLLTTHRPEVRRPSSIMSTSGAGGGVGGLIPFAPPAGGVASSFTCKVPKVHFSDIPENPRHSLSCSALNIGATCLSPDDNEDQGGGGRRGIGSHGIIKLHGRNEGVNGALALGVEGPSGGGNV